MGVSSSKDEDMENQAQHIPARISVNPHIHGGYDPQMGGMVTGDGGWGGGELGVMAGGQEVVGGDVRATIQGGLQMEEGYPSSYDDANRLGLTSEAVTVTDDDGKYYFMILLLQTILILLVFCCC